MKLTEKMLDGLPQNIRPFDRSKIWKRYKKDELLYKFKDTDFAEIRLVGDYFDLYIEKDWMYSIGKWGDDFFLREVGFEDEKDVYKLYAAATGMHAARLPAAGSFAALFINEKIV